MGKIQFVCLVYLGLNCQSKKRPYEEQIMISSYRLCSVEVKSLQIEELST